MRLRANPTAADGADQQQGRRAGGQEEERGERGGETKCHSEKRLHTHVRAEEQKMHQCTIYFCHLCFSFFPLDCSTPAVCLCCSPTTTRDGKVEGKVFSAHFQKKSFDGNVSPA